jgi:glycosyltransferase involved in cell wall biosynthesis
MDLVSIIVPVHNERATLATCIQQLLAVDLGAPREVVIADDGSTDGSADVAKRIAEEHDEVRGVYLPRRRGKGAAVRAALAEARGSIVAIHDADLEYDAEDVARALKPVLQGNADVVYGSRFAPGMERRVLYYRHAIGNRFVTFLSNLLTDLNLTDVETGCKVFRMDLVRQLPIRSASFTFEIEITAKLASLGARFYEIPISYHGRSYLEGKKISWVDGVWALLAALRFAAFKDLGPPRAATRARHAHDRLRRHNARVARLVLRDCGDRIVDLLPGLGQTTAHAIKSERVVCVERDDEKRAFLAGHFAHRTNVRVLEGTPIQGDVLAAVKEEAPDTLLCVNALSRMEDDQSVLRAYAEFMPSGSRIVVFEPAGAWLFSPLDKASGRLRRYGRAELRDKLQSAGFTVDRMKSVNRAGVLAWFLWGKVLRRRSPTGLFAALADRFDLLWRVLDYLLPLPGLSIFAVGRKP